MDPTEAMEDYEFIDKKELEEAGPPKPVDLASSAASSASILHDRITHLQNLNTEEEEEEDEGTDVEVSSPVARGELRVDHGLEVGLPFSESIPGHNRRSNGHYTDHINSWTYNELLEELTSVASDLTSFLECHILVGLLS
jgi:hypothetical protein